MRLDRAQWDQYRALKARREQRDAIDRQVAELEQRLKVARAKLKLQQERFSQRIGASYTEGPVSYADVLLGARDFNDFLDRQYYVEKIAHRDSEVLGSLRAAKQQVADERVVLLKRQQALVALEGELAGHEQQVLDLMEGWNRDRKPKVPGAVVTREGEGLVVTFESGLLFDFDSDQLRDASKANLDNLANSLSQFVIEIPGEWLELLRVYSEK